MINYYNQMVHTIEKLKKSQLDVIERILRKAKFEDKNVFLIGNGGSASTCNHICNDLTKIANMRVFSLVNVSTITAYANDMGYDNIFVEQLKKVLLPEDIVIGISGSGDSTNIIKAIKYANAHKSRTIAFLGFDGGQLKGIVGNFILIKSKNYGIIEDLHLSLGHYFAQKLMENEKKY